MKKQTNNRFSCLKSSGEEKKPTRRNRFQKPRVNNRWKRSKSPPSERRNAFTAPKRGRNGGRHFRHKKRGGESKLFKNKQKDALGRPIIAGATTGGFDFGLALQMSKSKNSKKEKKKKCKPKPVEKVETVQENVVTEEEQKKADEWKKQMILSMQYDMDITMEEYEEFYVECDFCGVKDIDSCDLPLGVCNLAEIGRGYAHESCMPAKVKKEYERSLYV